VTDRSLFVGVDIGGTFTDVVLVEHASGRTWNAKTLTTSARPEAGVVTGIVDALAQAGAAGRDVRRLVHATTLATNLVLERKGARVAYVATRGFGPLFHLQQLGRTSPEIFDAIPTGPPPAPLVPLDRILEVGGRMAWEGTVIEPWDEADAHATVDALARLEPQAVAVCLLHAYANPDHEQRLGELIRRRLPDVYTALSSDVWPEAGEIERASTTVLSAYVGPIMARYLSVLEAELATRGVTCAVQVMQSSGSVMPAEVASRKAVSSIESGPAAGVIASAEIARRTGRRNLLSFDMGGTTAKVGLIRDGQPAITSSFRVGGRVSAGHQADGETIRIPVIDLAEVGAGGGSIASVDDGGFLRVGPRSAGASPGPACYGLGGEDPTVTDANVVLGYLGAGSFLGGTMRIRPDLGRDAIARRIAERLDLDVVTAAHGIHELANVHMGTAVRLLTIQRGIDPREFAVTALGGAGPLHIARIAEQFGVGTIVVPPSPGVASAYGLLTTDIAYDFVRSAHVDAGRDRATELQRMFDDMEAVGRDELRREHLADTAVRIERSARMHFQYQAGQLTVPFPAGPITEETVHDVEERFRDRYEELYLVRPDEVCVFVNVAVRAIGTVAKAQRAAVPITGRDPEHARTGARAVYFVEADGFTSTPVYDRLRLRPGDHVDGPAVIEEPDSTIVCPPGYTAAVDEHQNVVLTGPPSPSAPVTTGAVRA
jgi:N-methylhydantoinase A